MELPHYLCEPHPNLDDTFTIPSGFAVVFALASLDLGMLQLCTMPFGLCLHACH